MTHEFRNGFTAGDVRKEAAKLTRTFEERRFQIKREIKNASKYLSRKPSEEDYVGGSGYTYTTFGNSQYDDFVEAFDPELQAMKTSEARLDTILSFMAHHADEMPLMLTKDDYELIFGGAEF